MAYRKLTKKEFDEIVAMHSNDKTVSDVQKKKLLEFIKKNFVGGERANSILLVMNSEYDDCVYNNSISTALIFDTEGNELIPKKGLHLSARQEIMNELYGLGYQLNGDGEGTNEPVESATINLVGGVPDLYVKE